MPSVSFHAFSFLQRKLRAQGRPCTGVQVELADGATALDLIRIMGLEATDIEAVFINGLVSRPDTVLNPGDRVAVVPPGTPGPYRVLLGMMRRKTDS